MIYKVFSFCLIYNLTLKNSQLLKIFLQIIISRKTNLYSRHILFLLSDFCSARFSFISLFGQFPATPLYFVSRSLKRTLFKYKTGTTTAVPVLSLTLIAILQLTGILQVCLIYLFHMLIFAYVNISVIPPLISVGGINSVLYYFYNILDEVVIIVGISKSYCLVDFIKFRLFFDKFL